jgi:hypothetical protein
MSETAGAPFRFIDVPEEAYPVTTMIVEKDAEDILFKVTVDEPGALRVPAIGRPVDVLVCFGADGYFHSGMSDERLVRLKQLMKEAGDV